MGYFKLGDMVWVKGKITKVIESEAGIDYEMSFEKGHGGWSNKVTIPEVSLVEKAGAEKCCSTGDDMNKESIQ